jgi:hypothetical protein
MDFLLFQIGLSNKMCKRTRESSISIKETFDDYTIIEWGGKEYAVFHLEDAVVKMFNTPDYNCEIIHNDENKAMISIEYIQTGELILRQEINSVKCKDIEEWTEDIQ